ncbi:MAG: Beta-lactamase, partial [uncultured Gemmatimonadetes bacterium]
AQTLSRAPPGPLRLRTGGARSCRAGAGGGGQIDHPARGGGHGGGLGGVPGPGDGGLAADRRAQADARGQHHEGAGDAGALPPRRRGRAAHGRGGARAQRVPQHRRREQLPAQPRGRRGHHALRARGPGRAHARAGGADDHALQQPGHQPPDRPRPAVPHRHHARRPGRGADPRAARGGRRPRLPRRDEQLGDGLRADAPDGGHRRRARRVARRHAGDAGGAGAAGVPRDDPRRAAGRGALRQQDGEHHPHRPRRGGGVPPGARAVRAGGAHPRLRGRGRGRGHGTRHLPRRVPRRHGAAL